MRFAFSPGHLVTLQISLSSFSPEQPGPFVHDLVLLLVPFPQVLEHLFHVVHGGHSANDKMQATSHIVTERLRFNNSPETITYTTTC